MKGPHTYHCVPLSTVLAATVLFAMVGAQITTPCTVSMITSFTPCFNFITGSSANGNSPTQDCCDSLKSLMTTSMACTCLVISANIPFPFPLPINRTLAISLPQVCDTDGIPIQCKASGSPLPAPGLVLFAPPPTAASPLSPRGSLLKDGPTEPKHTLRTRGMGRLLALHSSNSSPSCISSIPPLQLLIIIFVRVML